ncbi:hypothetical protein BDB00DRAFT_796639 [Zychaea mexicana]|uniref:uncharacterized protein n=1 Tax=Zychaea mexicana TaxID=64656 RepID=UPI0022FE68CA|nr:uncharacterized protein BDB00DRAFT_796639 [Zychaea mexicana]KAI9499384.1 hypothetical protein BDB00DRAFT_796639 [Zychaea mexicana]
METCVVPYTPSHHSCNDAAFAPPPSPTPSPASASVEHGKKSIKDTSNDSINLQKDGNSSPATIENRAAPTTPRPCPKPINQLHRRLSRYPSTTLSDLIPAATAALKASQQLKESEKKQQQQQQQQQEETEVAGTTFARALAKVRIQVKTQRLKEKYLTHEWIRLALGLPVDESIINNTKYPLPPMKRKQRVDTTSSATNNNNKGDKALETTTTTTASENKKSIRMVALKSLNGRTGEIATWYEWKIDKSKFTVEEVETKVDRLRTRIQEKKQQQQHQQQQPQQLVAIAADA